MFIVPAEQFWLSACKSSFYILKVMTSALHRNDTIRIIGNRAVVEDIQSFKVIRNNWKVYFLSRPCLITYLYVLTLCGETKRGHNYHVPSFTHLTRFIIIMKLFRGWRVRATWAYGPCSFDSHYLIKWSRRYGHHNEVNITFYFHFDRYE